MPCATPRPACRFLDVGLGHASEIEQLGQPRKIGLEIKARAVGPVTASLAQAELGVEHEFEGFLGAQRNGRGIVFHIQSIELKRGTQHAPATR